MARRMTLTLMLAGHREISKMLKENVKDAQSATSAVHDLADAYAAMGDAGKTLKLASEALEKTQKIHADKTHSGPYSSSDFLDKTEKFSSFPSVTSGPYQRLEKLLGQRNFLTTAGEAHDSSRMKDLGVQIANAQKQVNKYDNPPSAWDRFKDAAYSSRYNAFGGSPLMGKSLDVLGLGRLSGAVMGVGLFVGALAAAAKATYAFAEKIGENEASFARTKAFASTDDKGSALLQRMGIDGQSAKSFLERLKSDPFALGLANRYGVDVAPGPYGTTDAAGAMEKFIEALRDRPADEQKQALRVIDREDLMPLVNMDNESWRRMKRGAREDSFGREFNDLRSVKFEQSKRNLERSWEKYLDKFSWVTDQTSDLLNSLSVVMEGKWERYFNPLWALTGPIGMGFGFYDAMGKAGAAEKISNRAESEKSPARDFGTGGDDSSSRHIEATLSNSEAMRELSAILAEMLKRGEVWGGGDRTRAAVPKAAFRGSFAIQMAELRAMPSGIV